MSKVEVFLGMGVPYLVMSRVLSRLVVAPCGLEVVGCARALGGAFLEATDPGVLGS